MSIQTYIHVDSDKSSSYICIDSTSPSTLDLKVCVLTNIDESIDQATSFVLVHLQNKMSLDPG